jgi:hypothetical protein
MKHPSNFFQQINPSTQLELSKSQSVRLWDIFFVGPFFIYLAAQDLKPIEKFISASIGIGTIYYNGRNYVANKSSNT